ncbi:S8 family peptidase [Methylobacterium haplocladii]|uniref:Peptidase S8/S53 domain-containing protein n=1 Tax=Methylobacterium haplocladii TaxID=1176176 RepID=A0A512IUW7_9HYPH|nr:S8 family peptidase [Methylobacterium haplocladii]GEP01500.1 hypothetical protein MHA02_38870 [Methylobacterium haplocladii]GJD82316.1 hypothetical protein HPGCJGGD_0168 [Methylobacterium haplocladii]GLS59151.1 hypothetical protein GCM10007887_18170 [Methylobacterium haplocladii]
MDPAAVAPERALVFEVLGPVKAFADAAAQSGFDWLAEDYLSEIQASGLEAEEEAEDAGGDSEDDDKSTSLLYLTMPTIEGLKRLLAWWKRYTAGEDAPSDVAKRWWNLFGYLSEVRVWGPQDRVDPSLAPYVQNLLENDPKGPIKVEFDLWFVGPKERQETALENLAKLLASENAEILDHESIPEIRYHGVLVKLPAEVAREVAERNGALAAAPMVMTIRPQSLSAFITPSTAPSAKQTRPVPAAPDPRPALAVLLDGYPVQGHDLLRNRIDIEEVDVTGAQAPVASRFHGTAMASLILHGDLADQQASFDRVLKVVPILAAPQGAHLESTPSDKLPLAMVYRAVKALVGQNGLAPEAILFNHSICDVSAPFVRRPSAWAKLLDHLSHQHRILFVVSAGNVHASIPLGAYDDHAAFQSADPIARAVEILRGIEAAKGTRGILSPAEAVNVVTVGALHSDGSGNCPAPHVDPFGYPAANICSAVGLGVNRSVKPDVVLPGGRQIARPVPHGSGFAFAGDEIEEMGTQTAAPDIYGATLDYVRRSTGTSNAAALATRSGILVAETLEDLVAQSGQNLHGLRTRAVMLKTLLMHGCGWGDVGRLLDQAYPPPEAKRGRRRRETITRFLGFGQPDVSKVLEGDANRITLLADDMIAAEQLHEYRLPVPQDLLNSRELRRITMTLTWCTPIHPATTTYRGVTLDLVDENGKRKFWDAVSPKIQPHPDDCRRGTTFHRVYEGTKKIKAIPSGGLFLGVQARGLHDDFATTPIPYALAVSIEVGQNVRADIYADVRSRARVQVRQRERV